MTAEQTNGTTDSIRVWPVWVDLLMVVAIVAVAAIALDRSWGRWPFVIVDVGRDLSIPQQIMEGRRPYLDVQYYYPPLTPYLLTVATMVVGHSLFSFALIGIAISAATAAALYGIVRTSGNPIAAAITALLFVAINLAGPTAMNANFIFPYAHAATLGILFVLLFTLSMLRYTFGGRGNVWFFATAFFGIAAALSKLEFAAVVAVTFVVAAIIHRYPIKHIAAGAVATVALLGGISLYFATDEPGRHWLHDNILLPSLVNSDAARLFYAEVAGLSSAGENMTKLFVSLAGVLTLVLLLVAVDRIRAWGRSSRLVLFVLLMLAIGIVSWELADPLFFRSWILVEIALAIHLLLRDRSNPMLLLVLPALFCAMRIPLNLTPNWYGFFLILPTYTVITWLLFVFLPQKKFYSTRAAFFCIPLFILIIVRSQIQQAQSWPQRNQPVLTPRGVVWESARDRAEVLQAAVDYIHARKPSGLLVLPEGVALNYLTGIPNPTRYHTLTPPVSDAPDTEEEIVQNFERTRPENVAILYCDLRIFGYRGFGADYNLHVSEWLKLNYHVEKQWRRRSFYLILLKRNEVLRLHAAPLGT